MSKIKIYVIVIFSLFSSCSNINCKDYDNLESAVTTLLDNDIQGYYVIEKVINIQSNFDQSEIFLNGDGTFLFKGISSGIFKLHGDLEKKIDLKGNWKLVSLPDSQYRLSMEQFFSPEDSISNRMTSYKILMKNKKPVIIINVGDPDLCSVIRFIKKE